MTDYTAIDRYIADHLDDSIAELSRLCAQPSISAQGVGIKECAELVAEMLRRRGFTVEIIGTQGHPVVYGEAEGASDTRAHDCVNSNRALGAGKTLLFYNHYDVQPPEPLELWETPPFEPTLREGKLYARGVSDDKGHIQCRLSALDAVKAATGAYPCRIKFVIEGEEETSSVNLEAFVHDHAEKLKADACVWEFGGVNYEGVPMQYLGLRGICYVELSVQTGSQDAHSGLAGSIFPNAAWRLVWALNTLKDSNEHIRIPGFYEAVQPITQRVKDLVAALPDDSADMLTRYGLKGFLKGLTGGPELRLAEAYVPTCTICGLTSGYQGPGSKTVLPSQASAKVDFRLVPDQDPQDIVAKLRRHLDAEGYNNVEINFLGGEKPARTDPDHPFVKLTLEAAREAYGREACVVPSIGGSGPNAIFIETLNVPVVTAGVGYPGAHVHAPNENMVIENFVQGVKHTARIIAKFGESA